MRNGWGEISLGDLAIWKSGGTPRKSEPAYWEGDIPWISGKTLDCERIAFSDRNVTERGAKDGSQIAPAGATLILVRGMSLLQEIRIGHCLREVAFNQDVKALVPVEGVDSWFLTYALLSRKADLRRMVHTASHGTGVLATDSLRALTLRVPPLEEQRRIAAVLGAFDDLIDTNQRLCESIQELSRALYSKFARVSYGTRILSEVAAVNPGSIKPQTEGRIQYLDIAALHDGGMEAPRTLEWAQAPSRARRTAASEDTLWSTVRPNRRGHALLLEPADDLVVSTGIAVVRPRNIGFSELYAATDRPEFVEYLMTRAQGSAYPAVRANDIEDAPLPELNVEDATAFEAVMAPLWHAFGILTAEQGQARRTRDELLPLLMSGVVSPGEVEVAA